MTSSNVTQPRFTAAFAAAGIVAMSAGAALAQQAAPAELPKGWFKACNKQADVDICNVQNIVTAGTGQLVTAVNLVEVKGKQNRKVFQVTVPTGRLVPPGIGLQVDGGKTVKLDYVICFPDRCVAEATLNDALVGQFKKGTNLTLTSVNFQNQPNPVKVSLQGFTGAYDGEPIKQADLQDRQKKLEAFVKQNNEDFAKKLKEEQDKAKAAN
jgi:invasion protein IalB